MYKNLVQPVSINCIILLCNRSTVRRYQRPPSENTKLETRFDEYVDGSKTIGRTGDEQLQRIELQARSDYSVTNG